MPYDLPPMLALSHLVDALRRTDLVETDDLDAALSDDPDDSVALLSLLVGRGALTPHQAREIAADRTGALRMGNYVLVDRLGEGAMGVVFKARHRVMDRVVAIKAIKPSAVADDAEAAAQFAVRFRREVKAAAQLNHPNVVAAYDADEATDGPFAGGLYLVMEFVEGTDLDVVLEQGGPMPWRDAAEAIRQAAEGMAYAHGLGVVHRDLKPANLMRDVYGTIKIADLGLARTAATEEEERRESAEQGAKMAGTINYMPPEQAVDTAAVDHRADIYALGATLFTLLSDRPLFAGENVIARVMAHRTKPRPSIREGTDGFAGRDDVPEELDTLIRSMCAIDPADRPQTMEEVAAALQTLTVGDRDPEAWHPEDTTALVVESSRLQARIIGRQLAEIGIADVHVATTGENALEQFEKMPGQIVLTSMQLPDMTGLELAERLRSEMKWAAAGVLLLSSSELPPTTEAAITRLAAVEVLAKPFEVPQLGAAVDALMRADRTSGPLDEIAGRPVLVADDSRVWRRRVESVLRELGFDRITVTEDGQQAIDALAAATDAGEPFGMVVTDYNMPRADGEQVVRAVRADATHLGVPVIMVTTELDPVKLAAVYAAGVSAVCNKSFEPEMVRNVITRILLAD